jgi:hypothetical protein
MGEVTDYKCISPPRGFVIRFTGAAPPRPEDGAIDANKGGNTMLGVDKQIATELVTVAILAVATFLSLNSEAMRPTPPAARQSGAVKAAVLNSPELPQAQVRDLTY